MFKSKEEAIEAARKALSETQSNFGSFERFSARIINVRGNWTFYLNTMPSAPSHPLTLGGEAVVTTTEIVEKADYPALEPVFTAPMSLKFLTRSDVEELLTLDISTRQKEFFIALLKVL